MNLKLNNDARDVGVRQKKIASAVKEERQRTGRYIAILVGICLFLLAIYHAWVRRIPIVASLVVPALIMFVYVGWVLYTASRDKHRLLDAEAAMNAMEDGDDLQSPDSSTKNVEVVLISSKDSSRNNSPVTPHKEWVDIPSVLLKGSSDKTKNLDANTKPICLRKPVILINDKPPEDLDQKWTMIVENMTTKMGFKGFQNKKKHKRKFCSRRHTVFKRSYSIA